VEAASGVVRYKKNGQLLYTSTVTAGYPLRADAALYSTGATVSDAVISGDVNGERRVASPIASPGGGVFAASPRVELSSTTPGAEIRYTLDGSEPHTGSTLYATPLVIETLTTIKAKGFRANWLESTTYTATYTFERGVLAPPVIVPGGGSMPELIQVSMSGPAGADIRYTTDGSLPTASSTAYAGPVTLSTTTIVNARCFAPDWTPSQTSTARFTREATDTTPPNITLLKPSNAIPLP